MVSARSFLRIIAILFGFAMILVGCVGSAVQPPPVPTLVKASDVFFDDGPNSKPAGSIIKKDVTIAGWILVAPYWNGCHENGSCEDVHFELIPDPIFVARNYGGTDDRMHGAQLPGNYDKGTAEPAKRLPIEDMTTDGRSRGITLNSFFMPGNIIEYYYHNGALNGIREQCQKESKPPDCREQFPYALIWVEMNAWNVKGDWSPTNTDGFVGRGEPPKGWIPDPKGNSDVYLPFNPFNPDGQGELKAGDYIVLKGTLWQDTAHYGYATGACRFIGGWLCADNPNPNRNPDLEQHDCWGRGDLEPHGGWIEMHPVDSMYRAEPYVDVPQRTVAGLTLCAPVEVLDATRTADIKITPVTTRTSPTSTLKVVELVDGRFTESRNIDEDEVKVVDDHVEVHVKVHSSGTLSTQAREGRFKATYLVWWEP